MSYDAGASHAALLPFRNAKVGLATARDKWTSASEAEAQLVLGHTREALSKYQEALDRNPEPREIDSMYQQAIRVADLAGDEHALGALPGIFGREPVAAG
jgi:hypothetical protein